MSNARRFISILKTRNPEKNEVIKKKERNEKKANIEFWGDYTNTTCTIVDVVALSFLNISIVEDTELFRIKPENVTSPIDLQMWAHSDRQTWRI